MKKVESLMVEKDGSSPTWTLRSCAEMFPRLKTVVLEDDGFEFDEYTFKYWTIHLESELIAEWAVMGETAVAEFTYVTAEEMNRLIENV